MRLVVHEVLGSTNVECLALARGGERGPLWIAAQRQTAGRGRRGRGWVSEPGNLHVSLLLTQPAPPQRWAELSFVAALAVHDAVVALAPELEPRLAIKWPNDLLLSGMKLAGILIEGEGGHGGAVAVGIGVNCATHPSATDHPTTDLATAGATISAATLFGVLSAKMLGRLAQWNRGDGFAAVRAEWLARSAGLGDEVRVRLADRQLSGRFEALDPAGNLVLRCADGKVETIPAGDVFFKAAPSGQCG